MNTDFKQFHPTLKNQWSRELALYSHVGVVEGVSLKPEESVKEAQPVAVENYINWDDPYKNLRPSVLVDFLRGFKLTK